MLQEYHHKQKARADNLDSQRKSLQETLAHLTENEVYKQFGTSYTNHFNFLLNLAEHFKKEIGATAKIS